MRTTVRSIVKEAKARLHGFKEGTLELGNAVKISLWSIKRWSSKFILPRGNCFHLQLPISSSSSIRGVSTVPKLLLLGLLLLQLVVLGILRSVPSRSTQPSSPSYIIIPYVNHSHLVNHHQKPISTNGEAKDGGVSMSTALDNAASSVLEEPQAEEDEADKIALLQHHGDFAEKIAEEVKEVPTEQGQEDETEQDAEDDRTQSAILEEDPLCKGGRIFVYNLPSIFNADLLSNCSVLNPWLSLCEPLSNGGIGKPMDTTPWPSSKPLPWYYTEQFSGEVIFHSRILQHACVTNDSESANIFYVPFYAGLDVSRYLWKPSVAEERDFLGRKLVEWLSSQPNWKRTRGRDHFTMIGRITWDFRRTEDKEWGSGLLNMPEMKNMTRLVIECDPWEDANEFGVPYPTSFHPGTEHQMQEWQEFVRTKDRGLLFSFAGATRKRIPNDFRLQLLAQCSGSGGACSAMDCSEAKCETPEPVMQLFLDSTFCLQPRGDSYTRRSIFDSVLAGCIPVFFWNQSSYWQYKWFFPEQDESYSVFIDKEDIRKGVKLMDVLSSFSKKQVKRMRNALIDALPKLVYATADHQLSGADAFDTAIDGILKIMLKRNLRSAARTSH